MGEKQQQLPSSAASTVHNSTNFNQHNAVRTSTSSAPITMTNLQPRTGSKRVAINSPPILPASIPEEDDPSESDAAACDLTADTSSTMNLEDEPWFWGDVTREEVNERMLGKTDGTFLVRNSTTPGDFTLTLRKDGANKLIKIYQKDGKFGFSVTEPLRFSSVSELVAYYRSHSLKQYNRNLDITLSNPLLRTVADEDDLSQCTVEQISSDMRQTHVEYLQRSREYDAAYEDYSRITHEVQAKRQALVAFQETLNMFDEQMEVHKKFQEEAQSHEHARLRENFELLQSRCETLREHKSKLEEDLTKATHHLRHLEREINACKPELIRLYRKRERCQRALQKNGVQSAVIQKLLQDSMVIDGLVNGAGSPTSPGLANVKFTIGNPPAGGGDTVTADGLIGDLNRDYDSALNDLKAAAKCVGVSVGLTAPSDYIPPLSVIKETKNWLVNGLSKQESLQVLGSQKDGTFLVRPSESRANCFALSVVSKARVHNCLIEARPAMAPTVSSEAGQQQPPPSQQSRNCEYAFAGTDSWFPTLVDLVAHYSYNSLKDHNPELETTLARPIMVELRQQRRPGSSKNMEVQ